MADDQRGLTSADEDTKQEVASEGGQASQGRGRSSSQSGDSQGGDSGRGFASMSSEQVSEIASKGGKAAHEEGTAHEFDSEEASPAGQKGGSR